MITLGGIEFKYKKDIKEYLRSLYIRLRKGAKVYPIDPDWCFFLSYL